MRNRMLEVGDLLEAEVQEKKITLTPKTALDRELAQALKEINKGKPYGPFGSAKGAVHCIAKQRNLRTNLLDAASTILRSS